MSIYLCQNTISETKCQSGEGKCLTYVKREPMYCQNYSGTLNKTLILLCSYLWTKNWEAIFIAREPFNGIIKDHKIYNKQLECSRSGGKPHDRRNG